jgi:hypothetical protein
MTKVVCNKCYGGFGLSQKALDLYCEKASLSKVHYYDLERTDPLLVEVLEELGDKANTRFSNLWIEEVPQGTKYRIDEYDGFENVMTIDEYDWKVA